MPNYKTIDETLQKQILATIASSIKEICGITIKKGYDCQNNLNPVMLKAKTVESAFLAGCAQILIPSGECLPPVWDVCRLSGRSVFTINAYLEMLK